MRLSTVEAEVATGEMRWRRVRTRRRMRTRTTSRNHADPYRLFQQQNNILANIIIPSTSLYQFVFATPEEWLYKLFMHQACVFENKYQYDMSNKILTNVISVAFTKGHIKLSLKEAIEAFQIKLNNKRKYLAFYIRKSIHNCYDAMTTSPCESMNRHIKHTSKATTLNNTR